MANYMVKCGLILWMYIVGVWAVAVPTSSNELGLEEFTGLEEIPVIKYSGPLYKMMKENKASLRHAHATGGQWERPADMPVIELKEGTILDFGVNGTLTKRSRNHVIGAFGGCNCDPGTFIVAVKNFGFDTGCITISSSALSGRVQQQYHGNPYPTMDVWSGGGCQRNVLQHFGVVNTDSCTNVNNFCGYNSFIGY
jgi:hypothetical protein